MSSILISKTLCIADLLPPNCVRQRARVQSRKGTLDLAADLIGEQHRVSPRLLFDALMERERLGGTGIGEGVAIPHCRLECSSMMAAFFTLEQPVDYDAPDNKPVDLIFALVVPREETDAHVELLSLLAGAFSSTTNRNRLRQAEGAKALQAELLQAIERVRGVAPATPG